MSTVPHYEPISIAAYLSGEQTAKRKHEYVEGVVYARVDTTNGHNRIATNGMVALYAYLRGKPCRFFNSDTKIRLADEIGGG